MLAQYTFSEFLEIFFLKKIQFQTSLKKYPQTNNVMIYKTIYDMIKIIHEWFLQLSYNQLMENNFKPI